MLLLAKAELLAVEPAVELAGRLGVFKFGLLNAGKPLVLFAAVLVVAVLFVTGRLSEVASEFAFAAVEFAAAPVLPVDKPGTLEDDPAARLESIPGDVFADPGDDRLPDNGGI